TGNIGRFDLGMARQSAQPPGAILRLAIGERWNESDIDQVHRAREAQLHERNQTLATGEHLGFSPQIGQHRRSFLKRLRAMIAEGPRIHWISGNSGVKVSSRVTGCSVYQRRMLP